MSLSYAMLGLLAERPRSGYELLKEFQGSLAHAWPASHSQIYPELARLAGDGLILQTGVGPRGAKFYELTQAGLEKLRSWLTDTEPTRTSRNEGLLRVLLLWVLEPKERLRLLEQERDAHQHTLDELTAVAAMLPPQIDAKSEGYRVALDYGVRTAQARVAWAEEALAALGRVE